MGVSRQPLILKLLVHSRLSTLKWWVHASKISQAVMCTSMKHRLCSEKQMQSGAFRMLHLCNSAIFKNIWLSRNTWSLCNIKATYYLDFIQLNSSVMNLPFPVPAGPSLVDIGPTENAESTGLFGSVGIVWLISLGYSLLTLFSTEPTDICLSTLGWKLFHACLS